MKTNPDDPAFPFWEYNESGYGEAVVVNHPDGQKGFYPYKTGLTKREYFAAMALQGLVASGKVYVDSTTENAVKFADTLINELNITKK